MKFEEDLFYNCIFDKANMTNINILKSQFHNCSFIDTNFTNITRNDSMRIEGCAFYECKFTNAVFKNIQFKKVKTTRCDFDGNCSFESTEFVDFAVGKIPKTLPIMDNFNIDDADKEIINEMDEPKPMIESKLKKDYMDFIERAAEALRKPSYWNVLRSMVSDFQAAGEWLTVENAQSALQNLSSSAAGKMKEIDYAVGDAQKFKDEIEEKIKQEKLLIHYYQSNFYEADFKKCWFKFFYAINFDFSFFYNDL